MKTIFFVWTSTISRAGPPVVSKQRVPRLASGIYNDTCRCLPRWTSWITRAEEANRHKFLIPSHERPWFIDAVSEEKFTLVSGGRRFDSCFAQSHGSRFQCPVSVLDSSLIPWANTRVTRVWLTCNNCLQWLLFLLINRAAVLDCGCDSSGCSGSLGNQVLRSRKIHFTLEQRAETKRCWDKGKVGGRTD